MALTYIYGLRPGMKYEVKVTSILGDFQTDSDPQEISIDPGEYDFEYNNFGVSR